MRPNKKRLNKSIQRFQIKS